MSLTLEDGIEIHGRALKYRKGAQEGAAIAEEEARRCKANGDVEGFDVWLKVSAVVLRLEREAPADEAPPGDYTARRSRRRRLARH